MITSLNSSQVLRSSNGVVVSPILPLNGAWRETMEPQKPGKA